MAYVLPATAPLVNTPADIRRVLETLPAGARVEVRARIRNWAHVRTEGGLDGWLELRNLIDASAYEAGQRLRDSVEDAPVQAVGHTSDVANLRLEPSRESAQLAQLAAGQKVELLGRRLVDRPPPPDQPSTSKPSRDAWYLVKADGRVGWILGRLVTLDIPEDISAYAQEVNLVAWFVLNTVEDNGRPVPQYLVADRAAASEYDFDHIRVFTWWIKNQKYVTAYVEGGLRGYFPIRVQRLRDVPHFRLRVVDERGEAMQRIYRLSGTQTRLLGVVPGWETDAMPVGLRKRAGAPARQR
jgi:hypothetical protein